MRVKHYEITQKVRLAWYGYKRLGIPIQVKDGLRKESEIAHKQGFISERELEVDCFLSILANLKQTTPRLIECGAGWGEWCMALAGVIRNKLIPTSAVSYIAFGIEGDRKFYEHMKRNFKFNALSAWPVHGAMSNHNGDGLFNTGFISKNQCGGNLTLDGTFKGSKLAGKLLGAANIAVKSTEYVPVYTIDWLIKRYKMPRLDILHIDVQGSETLVLQGARESLKIIDYILLGTHAPNLHRQVKDMLAATHYIVVEALPGRVNYIDGLPPVLISKGQDGLILFKRRGL